MADYNSSYTGAQIDANLAKAATAVQPTNNATVLGSGSATNGQVLAANGSGGTSWATASGGGTPGGTDTQVQFNDGGAFGGDSGFTFDKTNNTLGLGGGTITADDPIIDMAQTWNNAAVTFTAIKANVTDTASAAGSLLMDLQVGGVSQFKVTKAGLANSAGGYIADAFPSLIGFQVKWGPAFTVASMTTGNGEGTVTVSGDGAFRFASSALTVSSPDVFLRRDAANTLAQRNGVNAQAFNLYNTYTDASNYERGFMRFVSNVLQIGSDKLGTGTARALALQTDGTTRLNIGTSGASHVYGRLSVVPSGTATGGAAGDLMVGRGGSEGAVYFGTDATALIYRVDSTKTEFSFPGRISLQPGSSIVCINGVTSAFPAIKRSTTSLQVRLADDTAFTNIQGKLTTDTAYTAGTIVATGYLTLYDSTGTAYRVPCVV